MDRLAIVVVRVATAALLWIHGLHRLIAGSPDAFGDYLSAEGFPAGRLLAWGITIFECSAPPIMAAGWLVRWIAPVHVVILGAGIAMVHAPSGWFVVGAGRNGVEFSVLLIVSLAAIWISAGRRPTAP